MNPPVRLDLHVHSTQSNDSLLPLEEAAREAEAQGLAGFALTDHNSLAGHGALRELRQAHPRLLLLPGVELSAREGHLLVYGVDELPPPGGSLVELLDWARARGAVSAISHPLRFTHGVGRRLAASARTDAIEVLNGHNLRSTNTGAARIAARRGVPVIGGSDAHRPGELGRAATTLADPPGSVEELLRQIRLGRTGVDGRAATWSEVLSVRLGSAERRLRRGLRPI